MDAKSFFAVLAVIFLLWLIRAWVKWDSSARLARESSQRLRSRLVDSTLATRALIASTSPQPASDIDGESISPDDTSQLETLRAELRERDKKIMELQQSQQDMQLKLALSSDETGSEGSTGDGTETDSAGNRSHITRLETQLEQALAKASEAEQSDLELRRLRSELASVQTEKANAAAQIASLEKRLLEQQGHSGETAVADEDSSDQGGNASASKVAVEQSKAIAENSGADDKNNQPTSVTADTPKHIVPLYEAPSYKDDLKRIKGIGPVMERTLNQLGVTTFRQLSDFEQADIDKVSEAIGAFPGRIERDDWVGKARQFVSEKNAG